MREELTQLISNDVLEKRMQFTRKVIEFAKQNEHILHQGDYYDTEDFSSETADLGEYSFRPIESFVPRLAQKAARKIADRLYKELTCEPTLKTDGNQNTITDIAPNVD
jgi:hypothetical protein